VKGVGWEWGVARWRDNVGERGARMGKV
jgi:hypothetical protein